MAGVITIKFNLMKNGMADLGMKSPIFLPGPVEPHYSPGSMLTFEGFSVDEHGKQHYLDATVAYRQACLRTIEYLTRYGYSSEQVYLLLSAAPIQGHVGGLVDVRSRHALSKAASIWQLTTLIDTECLHDFVSAGTNIRL